MKPVRYVVKRTNATRDCPALLPTTLGFVVGESMAVAAQVAHARWPCDGENQIMVLTPLGRARKDEIRAAYEAEQAQEFGDSFGKYRVRICACQAMTYSHPKDPKPYCDWCGRTIKTVRSVLVDLEVETRTEIAEVEQRHTD